MLSPFAPGSYHARSSTWRTEVHDDIPRHSLELCLLCRYYSPSLAANSITVTRMFLRRHIPCIWRSPRTVRMSPRADRPWLSCKSSWCSYDHRCLSSAGIAWVLATWDWLCPCRALISRFLFLGSWWKRMIQRNKHLVYNVRRVPSV